MQLSNEFHRKRQLCNQAISSHAPASAQVKTTKSSLTYATDLFELMETLFKAANVFDPIRLPRQRIWWLENLAALHSLRNNRVEGGEIRWQIYNVCVNVRKTWLTQWAPRHTLEFGNSVGNNNTPLNPTMGVNFSNKASGNVTFLSALQAALTTPVCRPWQSVLQHNTHMETCLVASYDRFIPDMLYLAERSAKKLLDLYRAGGKIEQMFDRFGKVQNSFKTEGKNLTPQSLGQFFWVQFVGRGSYILRLVSYFCCCVMN
jgi:hypothetical protein